MKDHNFTSRRNVTRTFLEKIRRAAKLRARNGDSYQSALEFLSIQAGFIGGWSELQAKVESKSDSVGVSNRSLGRIQSKSPVLKHIPFWERSESELSQWYLKPFIAEQDTSNGLRILCLDGRIWNTASVILTWNDSECRDDLIELSKDRYQFLLTNSYVEVQPHGLREGFSKLKLNWRHTALTRRIYSELLYADENVENVKLRKKMFDEIRCQRLEKIDEIFAFDELCSMQQ